MGLDAKSRLEREDVCLRLAAGILPVPPVLAKDDTRCVLRLGYVAGIPGPDLIEQGGAQQALAAAGSLLARLQTDASPVLLPRLEGAGTVLVHGDFGLHNLIFDLTGRYVTGLVDWELAHRGNEVEDLAWAEWIIRMHYPVAIDALDGLFGGYGARPPWDVRHNAMVTQCEDYFGSKEHLVAVALAEELHDWMQPVLDLLADSNDPVTRLLEAVSALNAIFDQQRDRAPGLLEAFVHAARDSDARNPVARIWADLRTRLGQVIRELRASRAVPGWVAPDAMAALILAVGAGTVVSVTIEPDGVGHRGIAAQFASLLLAASTNRTR